MSLRMQQIQTQTQVLAPQLRQSLKILQASAFDLKAVIQTEMKMNPLLEELPSENISLDEPQFDTQNDPFSESNYESSSANNYADQAISSKRHDFLMESLTAEVSLQEHLMEQVGCLDIPDKQRQLIAFIVGSLDNKGFLDLPVDEIILQTRSTLKNIQEALHIIQQLDPVGVGCKDIASSLLVQLKHKQKENSLAFKIIDQCYALLLRNKIQEIARHLKVRIEDVQKAIKNDIAKLNPAPGARFSSQPSQCIIPDVKIYKNYLNEWTVEVNHQYIPKLQIGETYKQMLGQPIKEEERAYLRLKMRSGKFLIQALLQRQKTIEQIARALLARQYDFFEKGTSALKPLTLQDIADDLGIHETTVSRATSNKYVATPFGVFSFKYFFTKGLSSDSGNFISNSIIKQLIQDMIAKEDKKKPLSDQKIVALLAQKDVQVARRTVTKYRKTLGIPATNLRRKYD